jgi:hypothetical protein
VIRAERNGYVLSLLATYVDRVRGAMPWADYATVAQLVIDGADLALDTDREVEACVGELVLARGGTWVESK